VRDKERQRASRKRCYWNKREEELQRNKEWRTKNKERRARVNRNNRLLRAYGITAAQADHMRVIQGNECAICKDMMIGTKNCHIDHDHKTNKVRDLLCNRCNLMIGMAGDNPMVLRYAINYLSKWGDFK